MTVKAKHGYEETLKEYFPQAVEWRRQLHKMAQPAWMEFYVTAFVAEKLADWGYEVKLGAEIIDAEKLLLLPDETKLEEEYRRALQAGAKEKYLAPAKGGLTGVVATLKGAKPGPVVGFRFDVDSNESVESCEPDHLPFKEGFASKTPGYAHLCGHDAHAAIGLLLAKCFAEHKEELCGTVKLIFQPNEENLSGAAAMVDKGVVDDLDYLFGGHIGVALLELGQISFRLQNIMAMSRFEVTFLGRSAHAAGIPHQGKNALHGACAAITNLLGIARHSEAPTRINVGTIEAGTTWNVIPERAYFRMETRGGTTATNEYMVKRSFEIIEGAAKMHDLKFEIKPAAVSFGGENTPELVALAEQVAAKLSTVDKVVPTCAFNGSEDITVFMDRVQKKGGKALFAVFGTPVGGGHHNSKFNIDERVIMSAAEFLSAIHVAVTQK
ncbi:MAG: amidohydrolase [Negativicutes bacterium]|nr:amidohydrolase [Negativicutes bacterium]